MKNLIFLSIFLFGLAAALYSQGLAKTDLTGTWDQNIKKRAATIIFVDTVRVRFSYKGHSGSTRSYFYLLDASGNPAKLKVDFRANHRRNRNIYLIQLVDRNTMKLQVIHKNDNQDHFDEASKEKIITLIRRT